MTVCIAAMADRGATLLAATDRMLTKGDISYEPKDWTKAYGLGDKAMALLAGSMTVQAELSLAFAREVAPDGGKAKRPIEEYARTYAEMYDRRFDRIRERAVLGRRSLTMMSYLANASRMPVEWVREIDQELANFELPPEDFVEAIFVGKDETGSRIFSIENGHVTCHDMTGYAVIGSGYSVADSQFIFAKHSPSTSAARAVYTLYRAKRMAEQSLGVGQESDWFVIADTALRLHEDVLKLLKKLYERDRRREEEGFVKAEKQIKADIERRAALQQQIPSALATFAPSTAQQRPSGQSPDASQEKD